MKHVIAILFMSLLFFSTGFAQSAYSVKNSKSSTASEVESQQVSLHNPWVGAKLSFAISDPNTDLNTNFIFSAKVLYEAASGDKFSIPIVSNIALGSRDLLSPESGVNAGVFPYYVVNENSKFSLVAHGGVNYKIVPSGNASPSAQQVRALAGLEVAVKQNESSLPSTLSVTPVYYFNDIGENPYGMENSFGIEATGIVPLGQGLGVLAEYQQAFTSGSSGTFRVGVIVNGAL